MDKMINDVIRQDTEAYLAAMKTSIVDYIVLRMQKGMGQITAIHPMLSDPWGSGVMAFKNGERMC